MRSDLEPTESVEPIAHGKFSPTEVDTGLLAVATLGSTTRAARHLRSIGLKVSESNLRRWRSIYPKRFAAIARRHAPEVEQAMITQARDAALNAGVGVSEAIDLERERIKRGEVKDSSAVAQRLAIAQGISVDKMLVLEGRPTQIVNHQRDAVDIMRSLSEIAPGLVKGGWVDSTATEESDPEEPPQLPPAS